MLFLQANSQVRTPTVYAAYTWVGGEFPTHFLIMEFLEGGDLDGGRWESLSDNARSIVTSRLCEQFRLLRSIPSEGYYGRVHRQGWKRIASFIRSLEPGMAGPYDTYEDFVAALSNSLHLVRALCSYLEEFHPLESLALSQFESTLLTFNACQPTFTHVDPALHNIIARQFTNSRGEEDWEVTLIDWEYSGWFPAYFQAVTLWERLWTGWFPIAKGPWKPGETYPEQKDDLSREVTSTLEEDYTAQVEFFKLMGEKIDYITL
jgi:aminoglycoside phosphotransferase (APT) family kinase protein